MTLDGHLKTGLMFALVVCTLPETLIPAEIKSYLALAILTGNVAPDFLEFGVIPHRTYTHYPVLWGIVLGVSYIGIHQQELIGTWMSLQFSWVMAGFSLGCLWHIVCDWPYYGGVPLFTPTRKIALFRWEFEGVMNRLFEHSMLLVGIAYILSNEISVLFETTKVVFPE